MPIASHPILSASRPVRRGHAFERSIGIGILMAVLAASTAPVMAQETAPVSTAAVGAAMAASPAGAMTPRYTINAGDSLDVFVWGEDRMQRQVLVQPDGTFSFPLAGTVKASGRNVSDIAAEIRDRISLNYRGTPPDVTVSVRETTGMRFFVVGKVRTPGGFTAGTAPNILQALSMAGGTADFADVKNAVILRQTPRGEVVEPVALNKLLKGGRAMEAGKLAKPLPTLSSGDVLVIP
ncbi:polysaccharide export outer membrane protein [Novosphingobium sp. PhB165]|uniref:polysaccharide biosynthesis/export family protein n=1 Tax=Novosphingobium sp. PhB165 TaxID=2485105 RepID=UPI0010D47F1A|nr:polysaccharide biosynthesis/export family protein [Novosphingobium sp. PhB165]TCM20824.1 polysaccharide export outer membrane protein [Novosphingobium sp. PhB165]